MPPGGGRGARRMLGGPLFGLEELVVCRSLSSLAPLSRLAELPSKREVLLVDLPSKIEVFPGELHSKLGLAGRLSSET